MVVGLISQSLTRDFSKFIITPMRVFIPDMVAKDKCVDYGRKKVWNNRRGSGSARKKSIVLMKNNTRTSLKIYQ